MQIFHEAERLVKTAYPCQHVATHGNCLIEKKKPRGQHFSRVKPNSFFDRRIQRSTVE